MREAAKYVAKSKNDDRDARVGVINDRIAVAEQFVAARQLIGSNPQEALRVCDELLRAIPPNSQVGAQAGGAGCDAGCAGTWSCCVWEGAVCADSWVQ